MPATTLYMYEFWHRLHPYQNYGLKNPCSIWCWIFACPTTVEYSTFYYAGMKAGTPSDGLRALTYIVIRVATESALLWQNVIVVAEPVAILFLGFFDFLSDVQWDGNSANYGPGQVDALGRSEERLFVVDQKLLLPTPLVGVREIFRPANRHFLSFFVG